MQFEDPILPSLTQQQKINYPLERSQKRRALNEKQKQRRRQRNNNNNRALTDLVYLVNFKNKVVRGVKYSDSRKNVISGVNQF